MPLLSGKRAPSGKTGGLTPSTPKPTPRGVWGVDTAFDPQKLPAEVAAARSEVLRFLNQSARWPNALRRVTGDYMHLRWFREVQQEVTVHLVLVHLFGERESLEHIARVWLAALKLTVDRSLPRANGTYAPAYRAQHDQPGIRRWLWYEPGDSPSHERTDMHALDRDLMQGHFASCLEALHNNRHLGGVIAEAATQMLAFARDHLEVRSLYLSNALHLADWRAAGRRGEVAPWMFGQSLRHSVTARYTYYACMSRVTGESYYAEHANALWEMLQADCEWFTLPDGTRALAYTHFVNPLRALKRQPGGTLWHPVVYCEETHAHMLLDALRGGRFSNEHLGATAALLAWTLPDQGWDSPTYPYSMGGGHPDGPYRCVRLHDGRRLPSRYGTISQVNRGHSFQIQRGLVFAGAPWSGVAGLEQVLRERERAATPQRGALKTVRLLYVARRAGLL